MIIRTYKKKIKGVSTSNEPEQSIVFDNINIREYPDMLNAYNIMSAFFKVRTENIILGNGCENILKNVLLALDIKQLFWSKPAWGFLDVYCDQLKIKKNNSEFIKLTNDIFTDDFEKNKTKLKKHSFAYYFTEKSNNLFFTEKNRKIEAVSKYTIVDCSYLNIQELKEKIQQTKQQTTKHITVLIGSFDKLFGCGLRLGFAIFFDKSIISHLQLQRENFINSVAYEFIKQKKFKIRLSHKYAKLLQSKFPDCTVTNNFITIRVLNNNIKCKIPNKNISVQNQKYIRFGIPTNDNEYLKIIYIIQKYKI